MQTQTRREALQRILAQGGGAPEAAIGLWRRVAACLAPVLGRRGVDALFSRALHVAARFCPWLAMEGEAAAPLAGFRARLEACDPAAAQEASLTLLTTFTDLLETLIGSSLTDRLLAPVWALAAPGSEPEATA
ncbi:MAG: hypothetical protein P4L36_20520 [Holophaga sp.]|nr:hypothetical protein [Holophaga sp.]